MRRTACSPILDWMEASSLLRGGFRLHTVGLGAADEDFRVLRLMAESLPHGLGQYHQSGLNLQELKGTMTAFSASVTQTRLTSTAVGSTAGRQLRPVQWEARASQWISYDGVARLHAPPSFDARWERDAETLTLLVSRCAFDAGGERNVFHARFEGSHFEWVAKESKHIEVDLNAEIEFHKRSLVAQSTCAAWAGDFNEAVEQLGLGLPPVEVNRCYLVVVDSRPLFVEPKIDGRFLKFNNNAGCVCPQPLLPPLYFILYTLYFMKYTAATAPSPPPFVSI